jgi:gliding motility-associated-like protein
MKRILFSPVFILFLTAYSQTKLLKTALPGQAQPEYFLTRAEREGWKELISERKEFSSTFEKGNQKMAYTSSVRVNYSDATGSLIPVDIRIQPSSEGWSALSHPSPVRIYSDASFSVGNENIRYARTTRVNGQMADQTPAGRQDGQFVFFDELTPGVTKQLIAGHGNVKYNYIIQSLPSNSANAAFWEAEETLFLPKGYRLEKQSSEREDGARFLVYDDQGRLNGGIHPVVCYDASGVAFPGNMEATGNSDGIVRMVLSVPFSWLNDPARVFPVTVDPLVTGPATTWGGGSFPSCFSPNYYSNATIDVSIPAGITVTALNLTANFYANPFSSSVMGDGRMFFSTGCDSTTTFQVTGATAGQPGTAYLDNFDLQNPLLCCVPQSCSAGSVTVRMHLTRTTNGAACNTNFIYYDAASLWPFSAYIEGYTPETYSSEMAFQPNSVCADDCDVNARIFARYGVPPFTFTHPWGTTQVDTGSANGCSVGNAVGIVPLAIPNCPNFCDPATSLQVPAPVVTDACGAPVALYDPFYSLSVKPVPVLTPIQDTVLVCSDQEIQVGWTSCLPGASISWFGSGQQGTGFSFTDTITNSNSNPEPYAFIATPSLNGCSGPESEVYVLVYPYTNTAFTLEPETVVVSSPVTFSDQTQLNGNASTGWQWTFGDGQTSDVQNPQHTYSAPGEYSVCLTVWTELDCSEEFCDTLTVVPADLELPNIVTPNGDAVNDLLEVKYLQFYPENEIKVYNRWGNLVFEKKNYKNDWNAQSVSDGVYFYIVSITGGKEYSQILHVTK